MKRVLAVIVSALVSLSFVGIVSAQTKPYGTDTHPPVIENQPGLNADTGAKAEKKMKKKRKKAAKKAKKQMQEAAPPAVAPNTTAPPVTPPPTQP